MIISENYTLGGLPQTSLDPIITIFEDGINSQEAVADLAISEVSGSNAVLKSATSDLPTLAVGNLKYISGASNAGNNGLWLIINIVVAGDEVNAIKEVGTPVNETSFAAVISDMPVEEPVEEYGNGLYYYDFTRYNQKKRYLVCMDAGALAGNERYKVQDIGYNPI